MVEELLRQTVDSSNALTAYLSVLGVLLACGLGLPVPEDITLITGGYLAHRGAASLPIMIAVAFFGILAGDSIIYLIGRRVSDAAMGKGLLHRLITDEKRARVEALFARHGEKIVMIARFLPGVRSVTYFTAGHARMRYWRFIMFDGLAALASAPVFVYLGYRFGGELEVVVDKIRHGETAVLVAMIAGIVGYLVYRRVRSAQRKALAKKVAADGSGGPSGPPEGTLNGRTAA